MLIDRSISHFFHEYFFQYQETIVTFASPEIYRVVTEPTEQERAVTIPSEDLSRSNRRNVC